MSWAQDEFLTVDLGDERLNSRVVKLAEAFSKNSTDSIPKACNTWNETKAAYRFFDNDKVEQSKILAPHAYYSEVDHSISSN